MAQIDDSPAPQLAACVQFDVRRGDVAANLASASAGIADAAAAGARLVALPEMWSTSFMPAFPPKVLEAATAAEAAIRDLSARHSMVVIGSSVEPVAAGCYNTARVYDRGQCLGVYRKIHLFTPIAEHRVHLAGDQPLLVDSSVGRLGVLICYDLRFPDLSRYYFNMGAEILVVPAQWPEVRSQHWRTLLRARAIENELFLVGCNRTGHEPSLKNEEDQAFVGDGRIIDPTGEILAAGNGADGLVLAPIELRTIRTMRRILPVPRDQRLDVYRKLWDTTLQGQPSGVGGRRD